MDGWTQICKCLEVCTLVALSAALAHALFFARTTPTSGCARQFGIEEEKVACGDSLADISLIAEGLQIQYNRTKYVKVNGMHEPSTNALWSGCSVRAWGILKQVCVW